MNLLNVICIFIKYSSLTILYISKFGKKCYEYYLSLAKARQKIWKNSFTNKAAFKFVNSEENNADRSNPKLQNVKNLYKSSIDLQK